MNIQAKNMRLMSSVYMLSISLVAAPVVIADVVDDAMIDDITKLCADQPALELHKIATKKKNTDVQRRNALEKMTEVSRECANTSTSRLTQYHQKMIAAAHDVIQFSEEESRQVAVEAFQYVVQLPDDQQPPEGSISRGNKLAQVALTDTSENIRLWALEALVTLRGNKPLVIATLNDATDDSAAIVRETASDMLQEMQ